MVIIFFLIGSSQGHRTLGSTCIKEYSTEKCQRCLHSNQCKKPFMCCPISRLCIEQSCKDCLGQYDRWAKCSPPCHDKKDPKNCTCNNENFPNNWIDCQGIFAAIFMYFELTSRYYTLLAKILV